MSGPSRSMAAAAGQIRVTINITYPIITKKNLLMVKWLSSERPPMRFPPLLARRQQYCGRSKFGLSHYRRSFRPGRELDRVRPLFSASSSPRASPPQTRDGGGWHSSSSDCEDPDDATCDRRGRYPFPPDRRGARSSATHRRRTRGR